MKCLLDIKWVKVEFNEQIIVYLFFSFNSLPLKKINARASDAELGA